MVSQLLCHTSQCLIVSAFPIFPLESMPWTRHGERCWRAPGELPGGSVVLGASASGATVYAEPGPAVALNNAEAALAGAEAAEEASILGRLTRGVAVQLPRLRQARQLAPV